MYTIPVVTDYFLSNSLSVRAQIIGHISIRLVNSSLQIWWHCSASAIFQSPALVLGLSTINYQEFCLWTLYGQTRYAIFSKKHIVAVKLLRKCSSLRIAGSYLSKSWHYTSHSVNNNNSETWLASTNQIPDPKISIGEF